MLDKRQLNYFKEKLLQEKERVNGLLGDMKDNGTITNTMLDSSELSFYDNHPADNASEIYDMERGRAFENNESHILAKINNALKNIEENKYGVCKKCGKEIDRERLDFLPYVEYCTGCQEEVYHSYEKSFEDRPSEEYVLDDVYSSGFGDRKDNVALDAEDSYNLADSHNMFLDEEDVYDNSVDSMDSISNESYKSTLPD